MKRKFLLSLLIVGLLFSCGGRAYMTIDDKVITISEFNKQYKKMFPNNTKDINVYLKRNQEMATANYFVNQATLGKLIEQYELEVTQEDIDKEIFDRLCPYFKVPNIELVAFRLSQQDPNFTTLNNFFEYQLKSDWVLSRVLKIELEEEFGAITEEQVQAEYDSYADFFKVPAQYKVAKLFIEKEKIVGEKKVKTEVEKDGETVVEEKVEDEIATTTLNDVIEMRDKVKDLKSFNKLAKKLDSYTETPDELVQLISKAQLNENMIETIENTEVNNVSEVLETETGFYLVWVFEKYDEFTFTKEQLQNTLKLFAFIKNNKDAVNTLVEELMPQPNVIYNEQDRIAAKAAKKRQKEQAKKEKEEAKAKAKLEKAEAKTDKEEAEVEEVENAEAEEVNEEVVDAEVEEVSEP